MRCCNSSSFRDAIQGATVIPKLVPVLLIPAILAAAPLHAQNDSLPPPDTLPRSDLPEDVGRAVVDFYNDPRRTRYEGPVRIQISEVVEGDVAALNGPLTVAGRIEGSVVMVNGDVVIEPDGAITGDVLVVGGDVIGEEGARVGGEILVYPGPLTYEMDGDRLVYLAPPPPPTGSVGLTGTPLTDVHADFLITTGKSYNRVEGLPITFGPRFRTTGSNPLRVHALGVYRTESGFTLDEDRMGYFVQAEQYLGGRREYRVGVTAHSLVEPIEEWHLSDLETGLATFMFHEDYRDHYEREGLSAFVGWTPELFPLEGTIELRNDRHRALPSGSPLTLFDNAEAWRPQPLVGEGRLSTIAARGTLDTRNDVPNASAGWYVRAGVEHALYAGIERAAAFSPAVGFPVSLVPQSYDRFTAGSLDLRRYNRLSPDTRLNFRLLLAGSLDGTPLPPQRQHALGGEGSLPGYSLFSMDCGARDLALQRVDADDDESPAAFFPDYGCDAIALAQVDARGKLGFRLRLDSAPWDDDGEGIGFGWNIEPDWTVFVDAGQAWAAGERPDEDLRMDIGAGLIVDRLGIFLATGLKGGDGVNLFVRVGPRF
jgi:hypothetical protein